MTAKLKKLIEKAWELERVASDANWPCDKLDILKKELSEYPDEKISRWAKHMTADMSLQHFQGLIVPLEREIQKNPSDEDFLVSTADRRQAQNNEEKKLPLHLALSNWRSAFNVGSIFRTADGLGVEHIHLLGYTATPENISVKKTSLGSDQSVKWSHSSNTVDSLKTLKDMDYFLVAFETSANAKNLEEIFPNQKTLFLFGNERFGINPDELKICDEIRRIPMQGIKNSLNASVCAALAIYEWKKQWLK